MSTWNLGIDDVSEETQAFKDRLSSKDSQIAAQQTQLMRKAAELEEIQSTLNDALHKLARETNRVLQLESDLTSRSDDLRNEKIAAQNIGQALAAAQEKIRSKELETRDLEAHLQALSHTSDGHSSRGAKLEREKTMLEARVRELEGNLQHLSCLPTTPGRTKIARPRSSSVSNFRVTGLEQELNEARATLSQKDAELRLSNEKLTQVQNELMKVSNERLATEKRMAGRVADLQATVEEKEDELRYLRQQEGDGSREEELMKRIEEDEAKIMALERLLRNGQDTEQLEERLGFTQEKLKEEMKRVFEGEERHIELIREKEEALDELENARSEISRLNDTLTERENMLVAMESRTDANAGAVDLLGMATDDPLPTPTLHVASSEMGAAGVERLLNAIARIRGERDTLKRSIAFLEYESKFAIEALEAKLATSSPTTTNNTEVSSETIQQLQKEVEALNARLAEVTDREVKAIREKDQQIRRLSLNAMASTVMIGYFHSQGTSFEQRLFDAHASRKEMEDRLEKREVKQDELAQRLKECEVKLDVTILCLEATTSQRNDLMSQLDAKDGERESEVAELKSVLEETQGYLEDADLRLEEISKSLQDVESERDSLTLQITNLMTDLRTAQDDLTNAESRYSSLQFHQLSSMSSNEATRALQDQIEELEMRIMRRTEQIGIHQHDIKRLETNLRLSEEHIDELTMELEMATAQKNAMVEDCADAREARDEALARLDQMEADMEAKNDEGDAAVMGLVGVVMETVGNSRVTARRLNDATQLVGKELHRLETAHQDALLELEKIPALESQLSSSKVEATQLTLALAASQIQLNHTSTSLDRLQNANDDLSRAVQRQQDDLDKIYVESASLQEQLETLQHEASAEASSFAALKSEFETRIHDLQASITSMETAHHIAITELESSKEHRDALGSTLESEVAALKARHTEELADMSTHLSNTSDALESLQTRHESAEAAYQRTISEAALSKQELEERLLETSERLTQTLLDKERLELAQKVTADEISRLRCDLGVALVDVKEAQALRDEIKTSYQQISDELAQLKLDQESQISRVTDQSRAQERLEEELAGLQSKYDTQSLKLEQTMQEVNHLSRELETEISGRSKDKEVHERQLRLTNEQRRQAESSLTILSQEMEVAQGKLEQARQELEMLQEEKLSLQEEITSLEAEIQRSISLGRFLESQAKESESKVATITAELGQTQADLARSEKSTKTAEVNLSLQGAQHKREMADAQRELASLRSQPNLQNVLAELEERNNEMEELLRTKCAEIEENDDRALEMLKDNKKLTTKVESLSRKVQNLQTKLAAAKASTPKLTPDTLEAGPSTIISPTPSSAHPVSHPRSGTFTNVPPMPPIPPIPTYAPSPITRTPLNRAVSGPSSLPRPKTPERRAAPPVFKARTPERRAVSMMPSDVMSSASTIGKKRRAPDDFEACESVPPQGFTADSLPSNEVEHTTPRVRRVLTSIQSGFTPVRNQNARPTVPIPSPKRLTTTSARSSPLIADVTNSPRQSAKTSKRSWLGKIRGVSTHTAGRTGDARPRFERIGEAS